MPPEPPERPVRKRRLTATLLIALPPLLLYLLAPRATVLRAQFTNATQFGAAELPVPPASRTPAAPLPPPSRPPLTQPVELRTADVAPEAQRRELAHGGDPEEHEPPTPPPSPPPPSPPPPSPPPSPPSPAPLSLLLATSGGGSAILAIGFCVWQRRRRLREPLPDVAPERMQIIVPLQHIPAVIEAIVRAVTAKMTDVYRAQVAYLIREENDDGARAVQENVQMRAVQWL